MSNKSIAIHQPNFLPWLGYFSKIKQSDTFVFLDEVQYTSGGYTNRVKTIINGQPAWLTMPVKTKGLNTSVKDVTRSQPEHFTKKILKTIYFNYRKSKYFDEIYSYLETQLSIDEVHVSTFNVSIITAICNLCNIDTPLFVSSELDYSRDSSDPTNRLINICRSLDGSTYISGKGGFSYQDTKAFETNGILVTQSQFKPSPYPQNQTLDFHVGMSVIDCLFNIGIDETANALN